MASEARHVRSLADVAAVAPVPLLTVCTAAVPTHLATGCAAASGPLHMLLPVPGTLLTMPLHLRAVVRPSPFRSLSLTFQTRCHCQDVCPGGSMDTSATALARILSLFLSSLYEYLSLLVTVSSCVAPVSPTVTPHLAQCLACASM